MKRMFVGFVGALFAIVILSGSANALTVYCKNCSTNLVQALDRVTNVKQLSTLVKQYDEAVTQTLQQIQMLANLVKQYENMLQNTVKLPASLLGQAQGVFRELAQVTGQIDSQMGDVAALGNLFDELYADPTFMDEVATAGVDEVVTTNAEYFEKWEAWSDEVARATEAVFQVSGQQLQDLVGDADAFDEHIGELLSTPDGQMMALDAANHLTALQLQEARQLRTTLLMAVQSESQQAMKAERQDELRAKWWKDATRTDKLTGLSGTNPHTDPF